MATGDIIDIKGRAHKEVEAEQAGSEDPARTYVPVVDVTAIGDPTDEPWDGVAESASVISLLKAIFLKP